MDTSEQQPIPGTQPNDDITLTDNALTQPATPAADAWQTQPSAAPAPTGISVLGSGAPITPAPKVASQRRRTVMVTISAIVLVAILGGATFWLYQAFAARADTASARLLPANTFVYVSVDLQAVSDNSHNFNATDTITQTIGPALKDAGLDWQKDIQPWLGQSATVAVIPETGTSPSDLGVGVVGLLQSRDDNASAAAISKAAEHTNTLTKSSYQGFTLYADENGQGVLTSGSGWVIFASNTKAAQTVIDRIKGNGDTLQSSSAFSDATSNLPSGRFGTVYVNLRQGLSGVIPATLPSGAANVVIPFLDTYPAGGGYMQWTDTGIESQLTFNAVQSANIAQVSGDTTGLAALVPADASAYLGLANVGTLASTVTHEFLPSGLIQGDVLQQVLGVPSTTPGLQQPGAAAIVGSGSNAYPLLLVRESDANAANTLLNTIAKQQHWTLKPTIVAGQDATGIYGTDIMTTPPTTTTTQTANGKSVEATSTATAVTGSPIGVAAYAHGALLFAPTTANLSAALAVANGSQPSLAQAQVFAPLTQQAGATSAVAVYAANGNPLGVLTLPTSATTSATTATSTPTANSLPVKAAYSTITWTNAQLQFTSNTVLAS